MNTFSRLLLVLAIAATAAFATSLAGCTSTGSSKLNRIYLDLQRDVADADPVIGPRLEMMARHVERADKVKQLVESGDVRTAGDHLKAAVLLVETDRPPDMELAEELARKSASMGEPHGLRVAAEAVDKRLMLAGKEQKYGTQYAFEWVLLSWRLYPCDPATTDGERAEMGVPTYAELLRGEDELNRTTGMKPRPR
jgi:hypothetical protein